MPHAHTVWENLSPIHTSKSVDCRCSSQQCWRLKQRSTLSEQQSTLLPKRATMSNDFRPIVKFRPFDKVKCCFDIDAVFLGNNVAGFETNWKCSICFDFVEMTKFPWNCCQNLQQCWSNIRLCRKNRSTCSIRQCCFVVGVDGALEGMSSSCRCTDCSEGRLCAAGFCRSLVEWVGTEVLQFAESRGQDCDWSMASVLFW